MGNHTQDTLMTKYLKHGRYALPLGLAAIIIWPATVIASGIGGVEIATDTVQKIVALLTGDLATAAFLLIIVLGGMAWWITRASRAGEVLGRTVAGAIIVFGAVQISEFFAFQGATL